MRSMAATFAALADPTRLAILERLMGGEASAGELGKPLPISAPAVSRHLRVLEEAGLISRRAEAQHRIFRIERGAIDEVDDWLDGFKKALETNYQRLDRLLAQPKGKRS